MTRTIPPWWRNPIVLIPGLTMLAILFAVVAVVYARAVIL